MTLSRLTEDAPAAPQILSAFPDLAHGRYPIKHLLIGAPPAVNLTIHELHVRGYAEAIAWSSFLPLPIDESQQLIITPSPGDVMSVLVKYLAIE